MIRVSFIVYIVSLVKLRKPEYPNITGDVHSTLARIHFIWTDYSELISSFFSLRSEVGPGLGSGVRGYCEWRMTMERVCVRASITTANMIRIRTRGRLVNDISLLMVYPLSRVDKFRGSLTRNYLNFYLFPSVCLGLHVISHLLIMLLLILVPIISKLVALPMSTIYFFPSIFFCFRAPRRYRVRPKYHKLLGESD